MIADCHNFNELKGYFKFTKFSASINSAIAMLRDREPGSFVIRNSTSFINSYGLALKVAYPISGIQTRTDDPQSELVRHFLIETVPSGGVHLRGFANESVYPSLSAFVYSHLSRSGSLPCNLVLPTIVNSHGSSGAFGFTHQQPLHTRSHSAHSSLTPISGGGIGELKSACNIFIFHS
ncbi:unnamed protein product [Protopolystoma xenopodis]|uniref:SH2 domain-containing protein n=1 Tax=Protopolystoma xenopodis TaxID=117903 RepID=A0A3S5CBK4_9PLAT|nr:unnamed protein product [Protopolystoma xenopodis]